MKLSRCSNAHGHAAAATIAILLLFFLATTVVTVQAQEVNPRLIKKNRIIAGPRIRGGFHRSNNKPTKAAAGRRQLAKEEDEETEEEKEEVEMEEEKEQKEDGSGGSNTRRSSCTVTQVMLLGENLFHSDFAVANYDMENALPRPLDQEAYNLPLYDPDAYYYDNSTLVIGSVQESLVYLPPTSSDYSSLECSGTSVWSLEDGQVTDQFTCQAPTGGTIITGGSGLYACTTGYTELYDITEDYFDGYGYVVWDIVACGGCYHHSTTTDAAKVERTGG